MSEVGKMRKASSQRRSTAECWIPSEAWRVGYPCMRAAQNEVLETKQDENNISTGKAQHGVLMPKWGKEGTHDRSSLV